MHVLVIKQNYKGMHVNKDQLPGAFMLILQVQCPITNSSDKDDCRLYSLC